MEGESSLIVGSMTVICCAWILLGTSACQVFYVCVTNPSRLEGIGTPALRGHRPNSNYNIKKPPPSILTSSRYLLAASSYVIELLKSNTAYGQSDTASST